MRSTWKKILVTAVAGLSLTIVFFLVIPQFAPTNWQPTRFFSGDITIELPKDTFSMQERVLLSVSGINADNAIVEVRDPANKPATIETQITAAENGTVVQLLPDSQIKPGKYSVTVSDKSGKHISKSHEFSWGVLAINTTQNLYAPGETVDFALAVLDDKGDMVCDSYLEMVITHTGTGTQVVHTTTDGSITTNPECEVYGYTTNPDFSTQYHPEHSGSYLVELTAITPNGTHSISDSFQVTDQIPFAIKRSTATRIYPVETYPVVLSVTPKQDFKGQIIETVPKHFSISADENGPDLITDLPGDSKQLIWNVDWQAEHTYTIAYTYDAPNLSPELYSIGPLALKDIDGKNIYSEPRRWQIAVDAVAFDAVTTSTSTSFSHTTSGSDRLLVVFLHILSTTTNNTATVTYNGSSMTLEESSENNYSSNRYQTVLAYSLVNPASGTNTVAITYGGSYAKTGASVVSYTGVDQTNPIGATTNTTATGHPSITLTTTTANSLVVGASSTRGGDVVPFTPGTGVTERFDWTTGGNVNTDLSQFGGDRPTTSAGNYTIDATGSSTDPIAMVALEIKEVAASGITVSGNAYNAGTSTALTECDGSTANIALRAGTTTYTTTCDDTTGAWSFSSVAQPSAGDGLVVWIDGEATDGATIIRYDGTGDSTGNTLYDDTVTFTSDDSTAVSNSHADTYDNADDADIPYTVTSNNITVNSGHSLLVTASKTYDPGGTITTNATGGNFHIDDNATAYIDTATSTIGADVFVDTGATLNIDATTAINGGDITLTGTGVVTTSTGTPTVTVSGAGTIGGGTGTLTFYNLSLSGTGTTTLDSALTVNNDLTIGDGTNAKTFDIETNDDVVDVNGAVTIATNGTASFSSTAAFTVQGSFTNSGTITENTSTITLDGSSAANLNTGCSNVTSCTSENLYNLTINKSSGATTVTLSSTGLRLSNTLTITSGTLSQGALDIQAEGSTAISVGASGTFSNLSTGDLRLGGSVSNSGNMVLQGNGASCGDADDISILSTTGSVQRSWSGSGSFSINDATIQDQAGSATIVAYSSTDSGNNGSNWTINSGCTAGPTNDQLMRHGGWFSNGQRQPFTF